MTIQECVQQLLEIEKYKQLGAYDEKTKCFGLARVGYANQKLLSGPMEVFLTEDMGAPLHSFVICADTLHSVEKEMYEHFFKQ
jgi:diphthine synthase